MNYQWHYDRLIETRKNRVAEEGKYYERHHILPKSMGGTDDKDNLIRLTAREHFLAHWLLFNIFKNKQTGYAFSMMRRRRDNQLKYYSSRGYELAKEALIFAIKHDNVRNDKISKANKNKIVSKLTREKQSAAKKGINLSDCHKENLKGRVPWNKDKIGLLKHTKETKIKISESVKKLVRTQEHNDKIGKSHLGLKHPHSEDTKQHLSKILSGKGNPRAKMLEFISPIGVRYIVNGGMLNFCKEHKLNYGYVSQILNHKRENNLKGWKIFQI